jgi:hypothetical protein
MAPDFSSTAAIVAPIIVQQTLGQQTRSSADFAYKNVDKSATHDT